MGNEILTENAVDINAATSLNAIQDRLRQAILHSGKQQKDIAKEIGVSAQTVSKYMKHDIFPALDTFAKLCKCVDVSSDYLLGISED